MVLKFDLPEEISGVTVKQAKLSIYNNGGSPGSIITAFRLTQDWIEDEVTWLNAANDTEWETPWLNPPDPIANGVGVPPEGMSVTQDSAKAECMPALQTGWEEFNVTSIIQKFSDGTDNFGFILRADDVNGLTNRPYHSSEYEEDTSLRPKLEITYEDGSNPISGNLNSIAINSIQKIEANGDIALRIPFNGQYELIVSTLSGRSIKNFSGTGENVFVINKSSLNSACYLLTLKSKGKVLGTQRLMVIK